MLMSEAMNEAISKGSGEYWIRPRQWAGTGRALVINEEAETVEQYLLDIGLIGGVDPQLIEAMLDWVAVPVEEVTSERLTVEEETVGICRERIEQLADILGPGSAPSLALQDASKRLKGGEQSVFFIREGHIIVGPSMA